ncbi:MAG: bifunctional NAD(P)H-dependent oxidoreductase/GNAT family N-acetyltransferase [Antricoccus sp.]
MSPNLDIRILVITASVRPGRLGQMIAKWFIDTTVQLATQLAITYIEADLARLALPFHDESEHPSSGIYEHAYTREWAQLVDSADAFIIVTPEYNYAMPASLKNAMDCLSREWAYKPVGFVSYGNTSAGTRAVVMAKQVATTLRMMPIGAAVSLRINDEIETGTMRHNERRDQQAEGVIRESARLARILRPMRRPISTVTIDPPPRGLVLSVARQADAGEILSLQLCCWVAEAILNERLDIPALGESLDDVTRWLQDWTFWCLHDGGRLVGGVRVQLNATTWEIGRLMVAPDYAGAGIGRWLLRHAEQLAPSESAQISLTTGSRSTRNLQMYGRAGYLPDHDQPDPGAVRLAKPIQSIEQRR